MSLAGRVGEWRVRGFAMRNAVGWAGLTALLCWAIASVLLHSPARANPHEGSVRTPVVVIGVAGLAWGDIRSDQTPRLWRMLTDGAAAGAATVPAAGETGCAADGWLSLSAGQFGTGLRVGDGECAEPPAVQPLTGYGAAGRDAGAEPARVADWTRLVDAQSVSEYSPRPGRLGRALAERDGCETAVGPGAALALADPDGVVGRYRATFDDAALDCPITIIDGGQVVEPGAGRMRSLARIDRFIGHILDRIRRDTTVLVQGVSKPPAGTPELGVSLLTGPATADRAETLPADSRDARPEPAFLTAASTRWDGVVRLLDVPSTLLDAAGARQPSDFGGSPIAVGGDRPADSMDTVNRLGALTRTDQTLRRWSGTVLWAAVLPQLVLFTAALARRPRLPWPARPNRTHRWSLPERPRRPSRRGRTRPAARAVHVRWPSWSAWLDRTSTFGREPSPAEHERSRSPTEHKQPQSPAEDERSRSPAEDERSRSPVELGRARRRFVAATLALAALPAAIYLVTLTRWWLTPVPDLALWAGLAAVTAAVAVAAALLDHRPLWRVPMALSLLTFVLLTVDAITGTPLHRASPFGPSALYGARYFGFGNSTFALFSVAALVLAGTVAAELTTRRRRGLAVAAVLAIGAVAVAVDTWPSWGADVGGGLALVPGVAALALAVAGLRMTLPRLLAAGVAGVVAVAAVVLADWSRPPAARTHAGQFVQDLIDGQAWEIVRRKAGYALASLTGGPLAWLTVAVLVIAVLVVTGRRHSPAAPRAAIEAAAAHWPTLRPTICAVLVTSMIGALVNDYGIRVVAYAFIALMPLIALSCARAGAVRAPGHEPSGDGAPPAEVQQHGAVGRKPYPRRVI
jgi:hypothetical protein